MAGTHSAGGLAEIPSIVIREAMTVSAPPQRSLDLRASHVREKAATGMPITGYLEASPFFARYTRRWDTSTCITKCARGLAATSALTTVTPEAKRCFASHIKNPVSTSTPGGIG